MSGQPTRVPLLDRVTTVDEDGNRHLAPFVMPLFAIVVLSSILLFTLGRCAVDTVTSITEEPEQRPMVTPSFQMSAPRGCGEVSDTVVDAIDQELRDPRMRVSRAFSHERDDGVQAVGVTIQRDDRAIQAVAAIFAADVTGKLFAVSSDAREMSRLPDGRETLRMTPVDDEAQIVNSCLRDQ
ncbi:MAG: hypothetical protein DI630_24390 [Gordonia sp. (in: high G+C Gram-positive bacteria)]|nr:MAG: hypothetical protein DI630_24390 [Gordonia sp. (in: high G+C Gram-positive bacteria)]